MSKPHKRTDTDLRVAPRRKTPEVPQDEPRSRAGVRKAAAEEAPGKRSTRRTGSRRARKHRERKSPREWASALVETMRNHPRAAIALAVTLICVFMLYGPTRDYYVARRTGEDLAAYQAALEEQNEQLAEDIHRLQTQDGVEDEARERGLVYPDETGVVVEGYTGTTGTPLPEVVLEDVRPWYVRVLDFVFGYEFGTWQ